MTKVCPNCSKVNKDSSTFCEHCGNPLPEETQKGGFMGWWNKQGTGVKVGIGIAGVCCVGLIILIAFGAMFFPDLNTLSDTTTTDTSSSSTPATNTESSSSSSSDSSSSAVSLVISYSGEWSGAISDESGTRSIEGTGSKTIDLGDITGAVAANAQKMDDSSETLTISLKSGGETLEKQSTSADYGMAQVSAYI